MSSVDGVVLGTADEGEGGEGAKKKHDSKAMCWCVAEGANVMTIFRGFHQQCGVGVGAGRSVEILFRPFLV